MADQTADIYPTRAVLTILALVRPLPLSSSEIATSKVNDGYEWVVKLTLCTECAIDMAIILK